MDGREHEMEVTLRAREIVSAFVVLSAMRCPSCEQSAPSPGLSCRALLLLLCAVTDT